MPCETSLTSPGDTLIEINSNRSPSTRHDWVEPRVTPELLDKSHRITPYDPDHLPLEIELIEAFRQRHPTLPQVACFNDREVGQPRPQSRLN